MAKFEELTCRAKRLARTGSQKLRDTSRIVALKLSTRSEEDAIKKLYCELGERYYRERGLNPEPGYEALCDKVTEARIRIAEKQSLATELSIGGVVDDEVAEPVM